MNKQDLINIKAIQKRFGEKKLKSFPILSSWRWLFLRRTAYENVKILNSINYRKFEAIKTVKEQVGWCEYGHKHFESLFTKFYQAYILPQAAVDIGPYAHFTKPAFSYGETAKAAQVDIGTIVRHYRAYFEG